MMTGLRIVVLHSGWHSFIAENEWCPARMKLKRPIPGSDLSYIAMIPNPTHMSLPEFITKAREYIKGLPPIFEKHVKDLEKLDHDEGSLTIERICDGSPETLTTCIQIARELFEGSLQWCRMCKAIFPDHGATSAFKIKGGKVFCAKCGHLIEGAVLAYSPRLGRSIGTMEQ